VVAKVFVMAVAEVKGVVVMVWEVLELAARAIVVDFVDDQELAAKEIVVPGLVETPATVHMEIRMLAKEIGVTDPMDD